MYSDEEVRAIEKLRRKIEEMQAKLDAEIDADAARKKREQANQEGERRLKLATDYGFENPKDAVYFLQYSENFEYELGLLARSGRLPMKKKHEDQQPPRIRL